MSSSVNFEVLSVMPERRKIWHWMVLAALSLIWGTRYILMRKGLESFSSSQIASLNVNFCLIDTCRCQFHKTTRISEKCKKEL
jgi:hypothetical protein